MGANQLKGYVMFGMHARTSIQVLASVQLLIIGPLQIWASYGPLTELWTTLTEIRMTLFENDLSWREFRDVALALEVLVFAWLWFCIALYWSGCGGLIFAKQWSRWVYTLAFVVHFPAYFFLDHSSDSTTIFTYFFNDFSCYIDGAIFALIWSPLWMQATKYDQIQEAA
jgi:hypothetical protein